MSSPNTMPTRNFHLRVGVAKTDGKENILHFSLSDKRRILLDDVTRALFHVNTRNHANVIWKSHNWHRMASQVYFLGIQTKLLVSRTIRRGNVERKPATGGEEMPSHKHICCIHTFSQFTRKHVCFLKKWFESVTSQAVKWAWNRHKAAAFFVVHMHMKMRWASNEAAATRTTVHQCHQKIAPGTQTKHLTSGSSSISPPDLASELQPLHLRVKQHVCFP